MRSDDDVQSPGAVPSCHKKKGWSVRLSCPFFLLRLRAQTLPLFLRVDLVWCGVFFMLVSLQQEADVLP
eukprot:m.307415 g.307415  ORF g.307415 m.307415 type:complete len:69 (+) comp19628_c1_seq10:3158-3364(+)